MDISLIKYERIEIPEFVEYWRVATEIPDDMSLFDFIQDNIDENLKRYLWDMKGCDFEEIDYPYEILMDQIADYLKV